MGLENMTAEEGRAIIKEIMQAYDKYKQEWIAVHGTEDGFESWFSRQVLK